MKLGQLTQNQISAVLEHLHNKACDQMEDKGISYQDALSKEFHMLWTETES
jgi:hypothetical protein